MKFGHLNKDQFKNVFNNPLLNKNKAKIKVLLLALFLVCVIVYVEYRVQQVEATETVCVASVELYQNRMITSEDIKPYEMSKIEFERAGIRKTNSGLKYTIVKWEDRGEIIGTYLAKRKSPDDVLKFKDFTKTQQDNSSMALYNNKGKILRRLDINQKDVLTFKKLISVGDKINIYGVFNETLQATITTQKGIGESKLKVEVGSSDGLFTGLTIAEILNNQGESILDYITEYNNMTVRERIALKDDEEWIKKTQASQIIVALTPYEISMYDTYKRTQGLEFELGVPQRSEE